LAAPPAGNAECRPADGTELRIGSDHFDEPGPQDAMERHFMLRSAPQTTKDRRGDRRSRHTSPDQGRIICREQETMMTQTLTFQPFGPQHLPGAHRLSREAGWPHRPDDWALVAALSRGIAVTEADTVVATALVTPLGPVAMANMIIVDAGMRGRGLGRQVMERAMALLAPQAWRLVATQSGLPLYEKLGFQACGQILQHQGQVADLAAPVGVRWAEAADLAALETMDHRATGAERGALIAALAAQGRIAMIPGQGYGVVRDFGRGQLLGPVIARDAGVAQDLLTFLLAGKAGRFMRIDTTESAGLVPWLDRIGLVHVDTGIEMQRGAPAAAQEYNRFALAAQALG
jgi:predicted N-acetyltransferase YhbS